MNVVFFLFVQTLHVFHLGIDSLSEYDIGKIPILETLQSNSSFTHKLKAEPYSDSHHGW